MAQTVKNLPAVQEHWVHSLDQEDLWRREWLPTAVLLPGESHGQRSLVGYSPWGHKESHRVALEDGSGTRVLLKSGPGNRGRSVTITSDATQGAIRVTFWNASQAKTAWGTVRHLSACAQP